MTNEVRRPMERRKFLIGLGSATAGSAALVGSSAYSQINADRSVTLETTGDDAALLELTANPDYPGDQDVYVQEDDIDTMELVFEDINRRADTLFQDLIRVKNNGTQDVVVFVNNDFGEPGEDPIWGSGYGSDGPMHILDEGGDSTDDSIVGGNRHQTHGNNPELGPGESANLGVLIDTRGFGDDSWSDGEVRFIADS